MSEDYRRCSNCAGRGHIASYIGWYPKCGVCDGTGRVQKGSEFAIPWASERHACPTCKGSGKVTIWSAARLDGSSE